MAFIKMTVLTVVVTEAESWISNRERIMARRLAKLGDKTTYGYVASSTSSITDGKKLALNGDKAWCNKCKGMFGITGTALGWSEGTLFVGNGDRVMCKCSNNQVIATSNLFDETGGSDVVEQHGQSAKRNLITDDKVKLDYRINLSGNKILTPLDIPDYNELVKGGNTQNTEKIDFLITNKGDEAEGFTLEVLDGDELIYSERQTSDFFEKGEHIWQWDGYSNDRILDTGKLKSKSLKVRLVAVRGEQILKIDLPLKITAKEEEWVDVRVDNNNKTIDVTWRLAFKDGGVEGSNDKLSPVPYVDLVNMAKAGVEFYWSRNGSRSSGVGDNILTTKGSYKVNVKAEINIEPSMSSFKLIECLDDDFGRSTSLKGFEKIYHNYGDSYKDTGDALHALLDANDRYKWDSAHEMGHKVLDEYGAGSSPDYSWTHKGTSSRLQGHIPGTRMPSVGEIDIMKYAENHVNDKYRRLVAADEDVQGLIWLSRVKFND